MAFTSFILYYGCQVINDFIGILPMKLVCWLAADTLNPMQIVAAVEKYLPELKPDHALCRRVEIYDTNENVFR